MPIKESLFYEQTLKYAEDCTIKCNLQGKQKLHLGILTLIIVRSLEGTLINYIYIPISINYIVYGRCNM